uniref:NAD(P)H-hydrate epimerase n=1 Tax=Nocardiopsis lucentensis TaxID=53441 RepID=UPI0005931C08
VWEPHGVVVLAGPGGNGGGGLVAARHLINRGRAVHVVLAAPAERFAPVPAHQLDILRRMGADVRDAGTRSPGVSADLVIDAVLGYSLTGDPREPAAGLIRWTYDLRCPVLSLDLPSGLDATTGVPAEPCVAATATMTLALPKTGLLSAAGARQAGRLYLADVSVPRAVYERMGIEVGLLFGARTVEVIG